MPDVHLNAVVRSVIASARVLPTQAVRATASLRAPESGETHEERHGKDSAALGGHRGRPADRVPEFQSARNRARGHSVFGISCSRSRQGASTPSLVQNCQLEGYGEAEGRHQGHDHGADRRPIEELDVLGKSNVEVGRLRDNAASLWRMLLDWVPILIFIGVLIYFMRQMQAGAGGRGAMSFGRSRAKLQGEDQVKITFADVAGCDEAKEEVSELVEFLRDPSKFTKLGGKIPRGVLMVGSPGTGKTCWPRRSRAKRRSRSSRSPVPISSRCSSASAPRACATCSSRPRSRRLASSSSTRSTRSAGIVAPVSAAVMTSASRP